MRRGGALALTPASRLRNPLFTSRLYQFVTQEPRPKRRVPVTGGCFRMAKTVLVVDDDPTQRRLIQAVLERDGFAVAHAQSGAEAIQRLASGASVDVFLLDLVMPGISGQDTLVEMRARGFNQPVIVLTATGGI